MICCFTYRRKSFKIKTHFSITANTVLLTCWWCLYIFIVALWHVSGCRWCFVCQKLEFLSLLETHSVSVIAFGVYVSVFQRNKALHRITSRLSLTEGARLHVYPSSPWSSSSIISLLRNCFNIRNSIWLIVAVRNWRREASSCLAKGFLILPAEVKLPSTNSTILR